METVHRDVQISPVTILTLPMIPQILMLQTRILDDPMTHIAREVPMDGSGHLHMTMSWVEMERRFRRAGELDDSSKIMSLHRTPLRPVMMASSPG
jgi:hypothetical protein